MVPSAARCAWARARREAFRCRRGGEVCGGGRGCRASQLHWDRAHRWQRRAGGWEDRTAGRARAGAKGDERGSCGACGWCRAVTRAPRTLEVDRRHRRPLLHRRRRRGARARARSGRRRRAAKSKSKSKYLWTLPKIDPAPNNVTQIYGFTHCVFDDLDSACPLFVTNKDMQEITEGQNSTRAADGRCCCPRAS